MQTTLDLFHKTTAAIIPSSSKIVEEKIYAKSRLGCEDCQWFGYSFMKLPCGNCIQDFYFNHKHTLEFDELFTQGFLLKKKNIKDLRTANYVWDKTPAKACINPLNNEPLCNCCEHTFCKQRIEAQSNLEITPIPKTTSDIDQMIEIYLDDGTHGYCSSNPWMWCHGDEYTTSKNGVIRTPIAQITGFHIAYKRKNGRLLFEGRYFRDHLNNVTGHISINKFHKQIHR